MHEDLFQYSLDAPEMLFGVRVNAKYYVIFNICCMSENSAKIGQ